MNNLLFTALLIALLYYFFYYLPQKKSITNPPLTKLTQSQFTQTEPTLIENQKIKELQDDIQQKLETIIGLNNSYGKLETKSNQEINDLKTQITNLQSQIRDLAKRPLKPTNSKSTQTDELTNTLDTLIKDIQDLNNSLN
jgi:septal ring factor EnvC (AmiA/AmiB activator)